MAALLKTGHNEPQIPKEARLTTGKLMWYVAPIRPVMQMKVADIVYPIQTQSHDCHQERPLTIMDDEIIQVFWEGSGLCACTGYVERTILNESAIQKATKFHGPHCLRSGSTARIVSFLIHILFVFPR